MATLAEISMKNASGEWEKFTINISDTTDSYGNNVSMFKSQTKEQREAKEKRTYVGNGKVFWTDGNIVKAEKKESNNEF